MPLQKEEIAKVNEYMAQKQFPELLKYVNELLIMRTDAELYNIKGIALMQLGNFKEAEKEFRNAFNLKKDAIYISNCADSCIMQKKYDKAKKLLDEALELDHKNIHTYNVYIKLFLTQRNYHEALKVIDKLILEYPENLDFLKKKEYISTLHLMFIKLDNIHLTFVDQAQKEMQQGNYSVAIQLCKSSIKIKESKEAYNTLGICYVHKNKLKKALSCFKKAYQLDNKFYDALRNVASCYLDLNDLNNSLKNYNKLIQNNKSPRWFYERSYVYMRLKDYKNALLDINYAIKLEKDNSDYYTRKAEIEFLMQDLIKAKDSLKKAIEINPLNKEARKLLKEIENLSNSFTMFR
ncbi:MAG: tetratricopeptide repeat protein [Candidatus Aenigmatarchaeota archaeon]